MMQKSSLTKVRKECRRKSQHGGNIGMDIGDVICLSGWNEKRKMREFRLMTCVYKRSERGAADDHSKIG